MDTASGTCPRPRCPKCVHLRVSGSLPRKKLKCNTTLWRKFPWSFWAVIWYSWLVGTHLLHIFHRQSMTSNILRSGEYASYTTFTFNDKQHLAIKEDQCLQAAESYRVSNRHGTQYFRGTVVTFMTEHHGVPPASHCFERKTCWFQSGPPWPCFKYIILIR